MIHPFFGSFFQTWIDFQAFFIHPQELTTEPRNKASTGEFDLPLPVVIFRFQSSVFWEVTENKASAEEVKLGVPNREHTPQKPNENRPLLLQKEARSIRPSSVFNHQFSAAFAVSFREGRSFDRSALPIPLFTLGCWSGHEFGGMDMGIWHSLKTAILPIGRAAPPNKAV